jgi:hypothetical protein
VRETRTKGILTAAAAVAMMAASSAGSGGAHAAGSVAVLQGLDKTTARISKFEAPVDTPVRFGTLTITVRDCRKRPPEEPPESAAFLEIQDKRPGDAEPHRLFSGWMFASSPALSALEHPVYDVGVLDCRMESAAAPPLPSPSASSGSSQRK